MKKLCTSSKPFLNKNWNFFQVFYLFPAYHNLFSAFRQGGSIWKCGSCRRRIMPLSLAEGLAVSTLVLSGVCFVGTHQNTVQRAVVLAVTVICTLLDGALNALVCVTIHMIFLLCCGFSFSMTAQAQKKHGKVFLFVAFFKVPWYDNKNLVIIRFKEEPTMAKIAPSILSADFVNLERDIRALKDNGA